MLLNNIKEKSQIPIVNGKAIQKQFKKMQVGIDPPNPCRVKVYFNYSNPDTMIRILKDAGDEKNKKLVEPINKKLNKMKKIIKNVPKDESFKI